MQKIKALLQGFIIIGLFHHCGEDDKLNTQSKFIYSGKEYPLTNGYMGCSTATIDGSFYAFDVYLFSSDTDFTGICPGFHAAGTGNGIGLSLFSESATELSPGVYAQPNLNSAILYQYVNASGSGGTFVDWGLNGSVSVSKSGNIYTITFNLAVVPAYGGGIVSGKFIGEIEMY